MDISERERRRIDEAAAQIACTRPQPPVIGIVPTQMPAEHILRVNDHYINAIVLAGGVPLILPITRDSRVYDRLLRVVDGFVLTGGQDVDPERYGIAADAPAYGKLGEITPMRDGVENLILEFALRADVPLLGTCRGMQTMNVFFGGSLYLDLPSEFRGVDSITREPLAHWQSEPADQTSHYISIKRGTKLHAVLGADTAAANSFHHQGVKELGRGLSAVAWASDGLVEAVEVEERTFMLGVQWHPEFFFTERHMGNLFALLVNEAAIARSSGRLEGAGEVLDGLDAMAGSCDMRRMLAGRMCR